MTYIPYAESFIPAFEVIPRRFHRAVAYCCDERKWRVWSFVLNWQFSRELPTPVRAGASALKSSCALGDGWIQLN